MRSTTVVFVAFFLVAAVGASMGLHAVCTHAVSVVAQLGR